MVPVRMKTELPTDLEGIRRMLLAMAPKMEARQPGITAQLQYYDFRAPMVMMSPQGETITIHFEPQGDHTAIKVEVRPSAKPVGNLRARFWRWRTRLVLKLMLKRAKLEVTRKQREPIQPEVLPPER